MKCPNCDITLVIADRQGIGIDYCPQYRGVWLDRGELDKIIERSSLINPSKKKLPAMSNQLFFLIFTLCATGQVFAQTPDSAQLAKEYTRLEEALKEPEKVYRLNLSNQSFATFPDSLYKFVNLRYLSLRNDHFRLIPKEIGALKNLRVLDLSGNDFEVLPDEFANLSNLEELYLDDDPNLDLKKDLEILSKLPKLKALHLDGDGLRDFPASVVKLRNLERLYLNNNQLQRVPLEIGQLQKLNYLEIRNNPISPDRINELQNQGLRVEW